MIDAIKIPINKTIFAPNFVDSHPQGISVIIYPQKNDDSTNPCVSRFHSSEPICNLSL